jgi:hypothetical protein
LWVAQGRARGAGARPRAASGPRRRPAVARASCLEGPFPQRAPRGRRGRRSPTPRRRPALQLLQSKPSISSVKLDLIPALCRHQLQPAPAAPSPAAPAAPSAAAPAPPSPAASPAGRGGGGGAAGGGAAGDGEAEAAAEPLPGADYMRLTHGGREGGATAGRVAVYMAPDGKFCGRVNTLQAYGDVNREVRGRRPAPRAGRAFEGSARAQGSACWRTRRSLTGRRHAAAARVAARAAERARRAAAPRGRHGRAASACHHWRARSPAALAPPQGGRAGLGPAPDGPDTLAL